jgi:hypothetical protein
MLATAIVSKSTVKQHIIIKIKQPGRWHTSVHICSCIVRYTRAGEASGLHVSVSVAAADTKSCGSALALQVQDAKTDAQVHDAHKVIHSGKLLIFNIADTGCWSLLSHRFCVLVCVALPPSSPRNWSTFSCQCFWELSSRRLPSSPSASWGRDGEGWTLSALLKMPPHVVVPLRKELRRSLPTGKAVQEMTRKQP